MKHANHLLSLFELLLISVALAGVEGIGISEKKNNFLHIMWTF